MTDIDTAYGRPRRYFGSAIIRQTLILLSVFLIIDVASLGAAYLKLRSDLTLELQDVLNAEISAFDLSATPSAMATIVRARARTSDPKDKIIVLLQSDGGQVGNARAMMENGVLRVVSLASETPLDRSGYLRDTQNLASGILLVGISLRPVAELTDTFLVLLILSLLPTALVSILTAAVLSRRNARRVTRIESTLDRISTGDLGARVPAVSGSDDLARIAAGVNHMAKKQEASTTALRQVTTDIAHELKTPLQRLSVLLEDLDGSVGSDPSRNQILDTARAEVSRAVQIFHSMLRISQIEGGNLRQNFVEFDLCDLVRGIVELHQASIEDSGRRVALDLPPEKVRIKGDKDLTAQALSNLLENAERHTPPGTTVTISVSISTSHVVLSVADNGNGVTAEELARLAKRFYRTEGSRTTPGHGLGLTLVSAVAELHGGKLVLEQNNPGLRASIHIARQSPTIKSQQ